MVVSFVLGRVNSYLLLPVSLPWRGGVCEADGRVLFTPQPLARQLPSRGA